jgi:hypothetical protein
MAQREKSRVYRDVQLSRCVDDGLARRLTYADIRSECLERFGGDRTPSRSSIARYARHWLARSQTIPQIPG